MDAERRSRDHDYHHRDLKSMLQELKALTQEWKDNTHSSMAEARRLINLDYIQEQHEVISRSLAGSPQAACDYQGEFIVSPFSPTLTVTLTLSEVTVTVSFEQRVQKRLQQLVDDIRVTAVRNGARFDDSVSAAEEVLQDITLRRSQNKGKGKLVFDDEDSEFVDPSQGTFDRFPHGKRDGFSTMNIPTLAQFPPFTKQHLRFSHTEERIGPRRNVVDLPSVDKDGPHGQEVCQICFDSTPATSPFLRVEGCGHRFCRSCIANHAEARVRDDGQNRVTCLHAGCPTTLTFAQLQRLLSTESFERLTKRLTESAIPEHEKVYCPYKNCSTLFVKPAIFDTASSSTSAYPPPSLAVGFVECEFCHRGFCLECAVPWHGDQSCAEYQGSLKNERLSGDEKFIHLVQLKKWRRCESCQMIVELASGCYHVTCRCGHSFCYSCGSPWSNGHVCHSVDTDTDTHTDTDTDSVRFFPPRAFSMRGNLHER